MKTPERRTWTWRQTSEWTHSYLGTACVHRWWSQSARFQTTRHQIWWWRSRSWWLQALSIWWGIWLLVKREKLQSHCSNINCHLHESALLPCTFSGRVLVVFNDTSQAKVCNFTNESLVDQDVGGSQISVDVVHLLNVGHALCNLLKNKGKQTGFNTPGPNRRGRTVKSAGIGSF